VSQTAWKIGRFRGRLDDTSISGRSINLRHSGGNFSASRGAISNSVGRSDFGTEQPFSAFEADSRMLGLHPPRVDLRF
jgi:hypothetical protein